MLLTEPAAADAMALLVGCTRYPGLSESLQLVGPKTTSPCCGEFWCTTTTLPTPTSALYGKDRDAIPPTRENIRQAFLALARQAQANDVVLIFLAGHGSQQPVPLDNDWIKNYKFDGLDEVFCPQDVQSLEFNASGRIAHGIVDTEFVDRGDPEPRGSPCGSWSTPADSATMIRGNGGERLRGIAVEQIVPVNSALHARRVPRPQPSPRSPPRPPSRPDWWPCMPARPRNASRNGITRAMKIMGC